MTNTSAWDLYEDLIADRRIAWIPEPDPDRLQAQWRTFAARPATSPKLWMDAYLAAFAITTSHQIVTTDKAFNQYKGLDVILLTGSKADS